MTLRLSGRSRRGLRIVAAVVVAFLLAGCQLRTELNITVAEDGSGTVELAVALDEEAVAAAPDLASTLTFDDLVESGWQVTGPTLEGDGFTWLRARHDFGVPEELAVLVDEIAGPDGPFRDVGLTREDDFARTQYVFEGTVDFTDGLGELTDDPDLAEALGAEPAALLERRFGSAIDELIQVQVAVRLPGAVRSNAPTQASNGAIWRPSVLERQSISLAATGTLSRAERLVWVGVAGMAGLVLVLFLAIRVASWRRGRGADAPDAADDGVPVGGVGSP